MKNIFEIMRKSSLQLRVKIATINVYTYLIIRPIKCWDFALFSRGDDGPRRSNLFGEKEERRKEADQHKSTNMYH